MKKQYDALFTACIGNIDYSELAALLENMETAHVKEYFEANNYTLFQSLAENENTMTIPLLLQFINKHKINVKAAFESGSHQALQQIMTNANPEAIKLLLQFAIEHNVDIEAAFRALKNKTINYIAYNKNPNAVDLLLKLAKSSGIDIKEILVMSGYQALDIAAQNEEVAIIELFLSLIEEYGLDIKTALKSGHYAAFRSAIQNSNAKVIELLFKLSEKHGIDIAEALQVAEYYIFQVAARSNNLDIIKLLLHTSKKVGIDIETAFSSGGCNTFRCMVSNTNFDVIKFLLQFAKENKIDLAAIFSANNYCAFQRITGNRNADVVNLLLETAAQEYGINIKTAIAANNYSIFIYALQNTNTDVIKLLFKYCEKHNIDIKAAIEAGNYAIFRSIAFKENYYNVKSLLETSEKVGADINEILKIHGYRMFQHAIEGGDSDVVNLLLDLSYKHNLDVKATLEQSHYKALQWIAQSHNANIAKLLIKFAKKKEINLKAAFIMNNYKALQLAARNINSEILDLFLQELTNIKESDIITLLDKIFDTIYPLPQRSIIIMLSHFIDLIETKDQKLEFNWLQYDRLNSLLKNSIFQNIELSEVNRYSIISSACKLAVLRKNVPGFLASKEEIEKWNDPNGARKLSIVTKDLISSDKNSSNKWIQLNKNLKAYILAFLTGDLGDYHNYSQVLTILRKSPYSKSMLKPSNVSSNSLSNDKPFDDFSGNGLSDYEQSIFTDIETQYYSDALHKLLALRLESVKEILSQDTVTIVRLNNIWQPGFDSAISELVLHAITKFSAHKDIGTMLAPINLYGKHWVGLILEKVSEGIFEIYYIDSANRVIDENIKIALAHAFADYDIKVKISELAVPEQKYGNCGSELVENFIFYLTGQRISQEDAIIVHYALLEDSLSDSQYTYRNSSQIEISRNVKSTWYNGNKTNLKIRHDLLEHVLKQGFSYNPETMDTKTLKQLHYFLETGVLFNSAANALGATDEGYTTPQQADNLCDEYDIPCLIIYKMTDFLS